MSDTLAVGRQGLYPPTVTPAAQPLSLPRFVAAFVRNPLRALPAAVYTEPMVVYRPRGSATAIAWVTAPRLVEDVLLARADEFPKTPLEKRIFAGTLGDGLLTSSGASWRWQRRTAAPLFRHAELLGYVPAMTAAAGERLQRWTAQPAGAVQPIDRDMSDTTFEIIARTMFSGSGLGAGAAIQRSGAQFLDRITWEIAAAMFAVPSWVWHPGKRAMGEAGVELRGIVNGILRQRRADPTTRHEDLLDRLMAARDPETGAPMNDEQLVDNLLTFFTAGHETTAKALTWTLFLLARAPDWQDRVRAEVKTVAGDGPISGAHIGELAVTTRVVKELMRLYPPAPVLTRTVLQPTELGGHNLAARTLVNLPIFAIHRHRKLWAAPDLFDPDRFLPEREKGYLRTQFMPFGFGPRICIGMSFALIEAVAVLATLVRGARFEWDGVHAPEPLSRITLRPKGGMPLAVTVLP